MTEKTRTCKKCGCVLPLDSKHFQKVGGQGTNKAGKPYYRWSCKLCRGIKSYGDKVFYTVVDGHKVCKKCKKNLPATTEFFFKVKDNISGLNTTCKSCISKKQKEIYKKNREDILKRQAICYVKNKDKYNARKRKMRITNRKKYLERISKYRNKRREHINNLSLKYQSKPAKYTKDKDHKLFSDNITKDKKGNILVACKNSSCNKLFNPTNAQVSHRLTAINGKGSPFEESNFYCSDDCKNSCYLYRRRPDSLIERSHTEYYDSGSLSIWATQVKDNANNKCEICYTTDKLHAHHIEPKSIAPEKALDPYNGICLCQSCHISYGHSDNGCRTSDLRKCEVS